MNSRLRPRINLDVPFVENELVKVHKPGWDHENKKWYIKEGANSIPFKPWMANPIGSVASSHFYIVESSKECWNCDQRTAIYALLLPKDYETFRYNEKDQFEYLDRVNHPSLLSYVSWIHPDVLDSIKQITKGAYSILGESSHYINHCVHCRSNQSDFSLSLEPGDPFYPDTELAAGEIILHTIQKEFSGITESLTQDVQFFNFFKVGS